MSIICNRKCFVFCDLTRPTLAMSIPTIITLRRCAKLRNLHNKTKFRRGGSDVIPEGYIEILNLQVVQFRFFQVLSDIHSYSSLSEVISYYLTTFNANFMRASSYHDPKDE